MSQISTPNKDNNILFELSNIVVNDILRIPHLQIRSGMTAIIGESGGGKTTLLHLLNRLRTPNSGTILFRGKDITKVPAVELRQEVTMLAQNPVIFPGDIKKNLIAGIEFAQKPIPPINVLKKALQSVLLTKRLDDNPDLLSGGEKQRLAIARILLMEPPVLLLDEPSSALDDDTEETIINTVISFCRQRNMSVVMVTHSQVMAHHFGDDIIQVSNGTALRIDLTHAHGLTDERPALVNTIKGARSHTFTHQETTPPHHVLHTDSSATFNTAQADNTIPFNNTTPAIETNSLNTTNSSEPTYD
ncbi:MAG: ABC transporter ATP-binding protein [Actinomycetaceae bacterium]|nr:ABC transporter ATP-binding protein [Actinomycetaceae bacterium]